MSFTLLGLLATLAGSASLYLASPNQRWAPRPWPARPARAAAWLLWAAAIGLFGRGLHPLAAAFCFATALMLTLTVLPYLGALRGVLRRPDDGPR